jgi:hypothetical protein
MINGSLVNGAPVNAGTQIGETVTTPIPPVEPTPPDPVPTPGTEPTWPDQPAPPVNPADPESVSPSHSYVWRMAVRIAGEDVSSRLTGQITIDREEGAAGLATFSIQLASGPVVPTGWIGRAVEIDFLFWRGKEARSIRRYTGQISDPTFDPFTRVLTLECTDSLQKRVEAMSIEAIDALVGGVWSEDVFEPTEGRSHWDYATERLSTRPASLDASPYGELRVTPWAASVPSYVFGAGTTSYGNTRIELAQLDNLTNVVIIEGGYRFPRLWQENNTYAWVSPQTGGYLTAGQAFCFWRTQSTELPGKEMVNEAIKGSGQTLLKASWMELPASHPDPCNTGAPWINYYYPELVLGLTVTTGRRWVQQITEQYSIRVEATTSVEQSGEQIARVRLALEIEDKRTDAWEKDEITDLDSKGGITDLGDETRRAGAIDLLIKQAYVTIISAHRDTKVSIEVPSPMVADVDLIHTLSINDAGIKATGKCRHIEDTFDLESGSAVTRLTVAILMGGRADDEASAPVMPPLTQVLNPPTGSTFEQLPTQISGRSDDPPYDDTLDGFSGSFTGPAASTPERYPRRFKITAPEIDAARRDEQVNEVATTYRIVIPQDTLEL